MGRINMGDDEGLFFDLGLSDEEVEMELDFDLAPKDSPAGSTVGSTAGMTASFGDDFDLLFGPDTTEKRNVDEASLPKHENEEDIGSETDFFSLYEDNSCEETTTSNFVPAPHSEEISFNWLEFSVESEDSLIYDITKDEKKSEPEAASPVNSDVLKENKQRESEFDVKTDDSEDEIEFVVPDEEEENNPETEQKKQRGYSISAEPKKEDLEETEKIFKSSISSEEKDKKKDDSDIVKEVPAAISSQETSNDEKKEDTDDTQEKKEVVAEKKEKKRKKGKKAKKVVKSVVKEIFAWIAVAVVAVLVIFFINLYVLRPSLVSGHSMDPTLEDGQTIMISKLPYIFGDVERGDIVVIDRQTNRERTFAVEFKEMLRYNALTQSLFFRDSKDTDVFWIKRVIAVEGDTVTFKDGKVYLNGEELKEDYILTEEVKNYPNGTEFKVGKGELFVMGDNRNGSADSRFLKDNPITCDHIVGKMVSG